MKNYLHIFCFLVLLPLACWGQWNQIGQGLTGPTGETFGNTVCSNGDGSIVAVSTNEYNGNNGDINMGIVKVFQNFNGSWEQIGQDLLGASDGQNFGYSIGLNDEGNILAVGVYYGWGSGSGSGFVRVYQYSDGSWIQIGSNINGPANNSYAGTSIGVNGDGTIVAIGAIGYNSNRGAVSVYQYSAGSWSQLGNRIEGTVTTGRLGNAVRISSDGTTVVVGSRRGENGENNMGSVRVYRLEDETWTQKGQTFNGSAVGAYYGSNINSLDISDDGSIIAIGSSGYDSNKGLAQVYQYSGSSWIQLGQTLEGNLARDYFGFSVSLNSSGTIVAAGAYQNDAGYAKVFEYTGGTWDILDSAIPGNSGERFGYSVSLDNSGEIVAIGSRMLNGTARVYQYQPCEATLISTETALHSCSGSTVMLETTSSEGSTVYWYNSAGSETPITTGAAYTTPELYQTTSYWVEAVSDSGCGASERLQVLITVHPYPVLLNLPESQYTVCSGDTAQLTANSVGNVIFWYDSVDSATPIATGESYTTSQLTENRSYWVEAQSEYGCGTSERQEVFITVNPVPDLELTQSGYEVCFATSTTLTVTTNATYVNWYSNPGDEIPVYSGSTFETPVLYFNTTYWVQAVNDYYCTSELYEVNVTVSALPAITATETQISACEGSTVTLSAASESNTINWYDSEEATEPVGTGAEFTTPEIEGDTSYWAEAVSEAGCLSDRIQFSITSLALPEVIIAATYVSICEYTSVTLTAEAEGSSVKWYNSEFGGLLLYTGENYTTPLLNQTTTYWVEAQNTEGCSTAARTAVVVTVDPQPELETNTYRTVCNGNSITLTSTSEGNAIHWYDSEDATSPITTGNEYITPEITAPVSYWVQAENTESGCISPRFEIIIEVNEVPAAPIAVEVQQAEEGQTLANLEVEAEGELTWYADQALTTILPNSTPVQDNTTYYVTQTINGCESGATAILVQITLGISDTGSVDFTVYPNPVKDKLYLNTKENLRSAQVYGLNGALVAEFAAVQLAAGELNLEKLTTGTYIVCFITEKEVITHKIIKK